MRYDEFERKLQEVKADFRKEAGKELETVQELEQFLKDRISRVSVRKMRPALKSLRGLGF